KIIKELIDSAECVFDWNKIADIPEDISEEDLYNLTCNIWSSRAKLEDRLMYMKYIFKKKVKVSPENDSSVNKLWKRNPDLPDKLRDMWAVDKHIMNLLFFEIKVDL